ncbi:hypothetical protein GGI43DRAFT_142726 [Trichoderma evansii]
MPRTLQADSKCCVLMAARACSLRLGSEFAGCVIWYILSMSIASLSLQRSNTSRLGLSNSNGILPSMSPPLVNGIIDGPSPHVPYDAAGAPPPSAATSDAQWIRLCTAAP